MILLKYQEDEHNEFGYLRTEGKICIITVQIAAYEPAFYTQFILKNDVHKQAESMSYTLRSLADLLDKQYSIQR